MNRPQKLDTDVEKVASQGDNTVKDTTKHKKGSSANFKRVDEYIKSLPIHYTVHDEGLLKIREQEGGVFMLSFESIEKANGAIKILKSIGYKAFVKE